jgi:hydrogenase-4 component B
VKAGIVPLHIWLPDAHPVAPSNVSALMSGIVIKCGIYGMARVFFDFFGPTPLWTGTLVLAVGVVTALVGVLYALQEHDLKRLLAYHSIENIGIIVMGFGAALMFRTLGYPNLAAIAIVGALYHTLNHAIFKGLLFLAAGSVVQSVHTRNMEEMGGLIRRMPRTACFFLIGAIAISGLPPLNGFVSELLLYLGLLGTTQTAAGEIGGNAWGWAALAVPVLAGVGALAVSGFVKLIGGVFQGEARGGHAHHAHDPVPSMLLPLAVLAVLCVGIGIFPVVVLPVVEGAVASWAGGVVDVRAWLPGEWWKWFSVAAAGGAVAVILWLLLAGKSRAATRPGTWDCGYARPTARMQYTGTSFGQMVVDLFMWALFPRTARIRLRQLFPPTSLFTRAVPDAVLDRVLVPGFSTVRRAIVSLRMLHQNSVRSYMVYLLVILVVLVLL